MHTEQKLVTSDKIVTVTTTIEKSDRIVDYQDIVDAISVDNDDNSWEAPWKNCDGWEHEYRRVHYHDDAGLADSRGYGSSSSNREQFIITISDDTLKEWGNYDYYHAIGCSKQVAFELTAQIKRKALDQLVKWYEDGWNYYRVHGEFMGYGASCGGIDDYDYAKVVVYDIADEIVDYMEKDGYIIENRYNPYSHTKRQQLQDRLDRNKQQFVINPR